jgi:GT2 family glycosyltransferase
MSTAPVTAVVVAYGDPGCADAALESLARQTTVPAQVIVVDNSGTIPDLGEPTVLRPGRNLGFTGGCNLAAEHATQPWLFFLNPDAVAAPDCVERLVEAADERRSAIAGAQILLPGGDTVNAGDNPVHVTGLSWSGRYLEPREHGPVREAAAVSGAALLAGTADFRALGGHCPQFFLYVDDTDLAWRARLSGRRVIFVPEAVVEHEYEFDKGPKKWAYLERNRLWMILSNYSARTLVVLVPLLLAAEAGIALQARRDGWWSQKAEAWRWLFRRRRELTRWRRRVQSTRAVGDKAIVAAMRGEMHTPAVDSGLLQRVNPWMERYRRIAMRLV